MTIYTFELCQKILEICNFWQIPWSYALCGMQFLLVLLEVMHFFEVCTFKVMHFFEVCNFTWRYALLKFKFITNPKQCQLVQCNIIQDHFINSSSLKECKLYAYVILYYTTLICIFLSQGWHYKLFHAISLCNFELCNIFWELLIT